jgi:uncharacterized OB-fold protein
MGQGGEEKAAKPVKMITTLVRLDYTHTAGKAQRRFLSGLMEGKLIAQRCPECDKVYVPPRGSCPTCAVPTRDEVEISDTGTVTTFCIVNLPFYGQAVEIPYVCASILIDGADIPLFAMLAEVAVEDVHMGQRVQAVWLPEQERTPSFDNLRYFKPTGESDASYDSYKDHL